VASWLVRGTRRNTPRQVRHVMVVPPAAAGGLVARVYAQMERDFGVHAPPVSLHSPAPASMAAAWLMLRESLVATGRVPRAGKEAVAVAVSRANSCPYCVEVHSAALAGLEGTASLQGTASGPPGSRGPHRVAGWAGWNGRAGDIAGTAAPAPAAHAAELIGTAVTFHYLNRMANVFLIDSPIPTALPPIARRMVSRLAAAALRPVVSRPVAPGSSVDLLPASPETGDLPWAAGSTTIADAFARATAALHAAGRDAVPEPARDLVTAVVADWDGQPPPVSAAWARDVVTALPAAQRPVGRLTLLAAMASYQVDDAVVAEVRQRRPDDRYLVQAVSWASMVAAEAVGKRIWRAWSAPPENGGVVRRGDVA
jgi:AhpD family alkylhydroperoxidase